VFEKAIKSAKILTPLKNFEEDTVTFEYRTDPLTGRNTTVNKGMLTYVKRFLFSDNALLNSLAEKTRLNCPFCPESVNSKTPMFTRDFLPKGRILVGESTVIPNLMGHAEQSILVVLSNEHFLRLNGFTPHMILNGFNGGLEYLKRLSEAEPSIRFPVFTFNYLPPAGSSIFHPHMQVLARDRPFYLVKLMLKKSKDYKESNKTSYWSDLISKEKNGERYLSRIKGVEWLVPFAPLRGLNEVQAIVDGKSSLLELSDEDWSGLAEGISKILTYYHKEGYVSFNIILVSGPLDEHLDNFAVNLRVISRPGVQGTSFTDAWALPYLLWDGEAVEEPEQFAARLRKDF
jgi:UDPglucose--hexose-1-phosphate uridylyltransferase